MIDIYICEDSLEQREKIYNYIDKYILIENLDMKIAISTGSPQEILDFRKTSNNVGLYFLDVDLNSDINGIELAAEVRKEDFYGNIVFVTTHSELAELTFKYKVSAMDYIIKDDFNGVRDRLISCIDTVYDRYIEEGQIKPNKLVLKVVDKIINVDISEIMYFESSTRLHKVLLHLDNGQVEFYGKLKDLEKENGAFIRCHKSYLVNKYNIKELDYKRKEIIMVNGEICLVSSRLFNLVKKELELELVK